MLLTITLISFLMNIQINDWNSFNHESNGNYFIIKYGLFTLLGEPDTLNNDMGEYIFQAPYIINKDTLLIPDFNYSFLYISDEIFISLSDIENVIKKNEKFYGGNAVFSDGTILKGGKWKNNKRDGIWLYRDINKIYYRLYYKEGVIEKKEKMEFN